MGLLFSKELFYLSLCLISLFSLASCASTTNTNLAEESAVKRVPPAESRINTSFINRQHARERY